MSTRNLFSFPSFCAFLLCATLSVFAIPAFGANNADNDLENEWRTDRELESFEVSRGYVGGPTRRIPSAEPPRRIERHSESPVNLYFLPRDEFKEVVRRPQESMAERRDRRAEALPAATERELERHTTRSRKLGRGISNVLFGWLEIPRQYGKAIREDKIDPISSVAVGGLRGIAFGLTRTGVGLFEIATFYKPKPGYFGVVMKPEFIITDMWGEPVPILTDRNNNAWEGMETPGIPAFMGK